MMQTYNKYPPKKKAGVCVTIFSNSQNIKCNKRMNYLYSTQKIIIKKEANK